MCHIHIDETDEKIREVEVDPNPKTKRIQGAAMDGCRPFDA